MHWREVSGLRLVDAAYVDGQRATRVELAARWRRECAADFTTDHADRQRHVGVGPQHRREQRTRVRMARLAEDFDGRPLLDHVAEVHHAHRVGEVLDQRQVVRNQQIGQAVLLLDVREQVEDLRANRNVECRGRLVEYQQPRLQRDRARHRDALALAAAELVRVSLDRGRRQADHVEQFGDASIELGACEPLVGEDGLGNDGLDAQPRVERGVRILEHRLHLAPPRALVGALQRGYVAAVEKDAAGARCVEPEDQLGAGGLAAA